MDKVKFLKIAGIASIALAMSFTLGCSDNKDDAPDYKWCKWYSAEDTSKIPLACGEFGKNIKEEYKDMVGVEEEKLTLSLCKDMDIDMVIIEISTKAEKSESKPAGCDGMTVIKVTE